MNEIIYINRLKEYRFKRKSGVLIEKLILDAQYSPPSGGWWAD